MVSRINHKPLQKIIKIHDSKPVSSLTSWYASKRINPEKFFSVHLDTLFLLKQKKLLEKLEILASKKYFLNFLNFPKTKKGVLPEKFYPKVHFLYENFGTNLML